VAWTDERLTERFDRIDHRFDEVNRRFDDVDRRFAEAAESARWRHEEMKESFGHRLEGLDQRLAVVEASLFRIWISILAGMFAVVAAIIAKGG
jgi:hypothetical protein